MTLEGCFRSSSGRRRSEFGLLVERGHRVAKRQCGELFAVARKECIGSDYKRAGPPLD